MTTRQIARQAPWIAPAAIAAAAGGAAGLLVAVDPGVPGHYPTCPFYAITYDPGAGILRFGVDEPSLEPALEAIEYALRRE